MDNLIYNEFSKQDTIIKLYKTVAEKSRQQNMITEYRKSVMAWIS